jgi:predicted RecB family nuclease
MKRRARTEIPSLSKTRFMAGMQCHKRLYWQLYEEELAADLSEADEAKFDQGTEVGKVAWRRFPEGVLVDEEQHSSAVVVTKWTLDDWSNPAIFEAAFRADDVKVRTDILVRVGRQGDFNLVEVKSSTRAKPEHVADLAIQLWVLERCGLRIRHTYLMHLNRGYLYRGGDHDLDRLFAMADLTHQVRAMLPRVPRLLRAMREPLWSRKPPEIAPGDQCTEPYVCEFYDQCNRAPSGYPIEELPRLSLKLRARLGKAGIGDIRRIPKAFEGLTPTQQRVRDVVKSRMPHISPEIAEALRSLPQPIHFLDFESFNPALPLWKGTRPYQSIVFQFSNHTLAGSERPRQRVYLHEGRDDPRPPFLDNLLDALGTRGAVVVWSGFEKARLRELAEAIPRKRRQIAEVIERIVDLLPIVRRHVYHRDFRGSFSIKSVYPALVPDAGWDDLVIQDGLAASDAYAEMMHPHTTKRRRAKLRTQLLRYCRRDTKAMVEIYNSLCDS